tara:strand:- start:1518 stop:3974 length:2457 start_codon:yes stop_codon:yes gene_type:complete
MYIGNNLQVANPSYKIIDDISSGFNGSTTSFALQVSGATPVPFPINTQQVMISVNGVIQEPDPSGSAGFKLLGSNIVFSSAPANGHAFFGTVLAGADYVTAGSEFPDGSVTAPSFTFESDQDSGFFRIGSGDVGYSSNGVQILNYSGNGLIIASGKGLTVDTNTLHVDATNNRVGIGTTSPVTSLDVVGDASIGYAATHALRFYNEDRNNWSSITNNIASGTSTGNLCFRTSSGEAMRLDSSGRLLIGHTANLSIEGGGFQQQIVGTDFSTSGAAQLRFQAGTSGATIALAHSRNATKGSHTILADNDEFGKIRFYGSDGTDFNNYGAEIRAIVNGTPGANDMPGALTFGTTADGGAGSIERMRIDSSGRLLLGTTTEGHADADDLTINATRAGITIRSASDNFGNIYFSDTTSGAGEYAGYIQYSHSDNQFLLGTGGVDYLRLDSSGRLKLGTNTEGESAADDLTIATSGNTGITIRSSASGYGSIYFSDATSGGGEYAGYVQYNHSGNQINIGTNGTQHLTINSSGNATFAGQITSQGTYATIASAASSTSANNGGIMHLIKNTDNTNGNQCGVSFVDSSGAGSAAIIAYHNNHASTTGVLTFGTRDAGTYGERMRIDEVGRLLLGTTTEGHASADDLTIATTGNTGITIRTGSSNEGNIFFSDGTSGDDEYRGMVKYEHANNALKLYTNAATALTLDSSQNATFAGTVSDSKGDLRLIPENVKSSAYTLIASDEGKHINISSGGVTVANSVFREGSAVTIINSSGSNQTITQGSGVTLYNTGDATTGNRTLSGRGMCTILFVSASTGYISGAGLS